MTVSSPATGTVHIVDDDAAIRESLSLVLATAGHRVHCWEDGCGFLAAAAALGPACAILDVRMPLIDGLAVQREVVALRLPIAVIILTGHADVPSAVRTLRAGAVNFLEKPVETSALLQAVTDALATIDPGGGSDHAEAQARRKLALLSPRELEVLRGLAAGKQNKSIAIDLGISHRTVEVYRANIMEKLDAASLSEVLYVAFAGHVLSTASPLRSEHRLLCH
ncbi:response regulator transcription factor [Sphingomonas japonica]|uniref:Two-component system response regulator FixJ n=1 Tax=Sphingomonas japonica TaxID=511662 RepID=A0ABX0TXC4_9SPHN|nr:response regulator [Sphingomonas japonica]NIJ22873.1 two-component system response regulator FixJ [Sphingomonas japonica]